VSRARALLSVVALVGALVAALPAVGADSGQTAALGPIVGRATSYASSPAVGEVKGLAGGEGEAAPSRIKPPAGDTEGAGQDTWTREEPPTDPLLGLSGTTGATPPLLFRFQGQRNPAACGGCTPPDTNGDVGPNHYVQMVNATKVAVYDKTGTPLAPPFSLGSLWPPGPCAADAGDPIVLHDGLADRWLLSQFADPSHMCVAISKTPDPLGTYHLYTFNVGSFPDYFKFGVWPDAYYMSANELSYTAYAFDRAKMLAGNPTAGFVKFVGQDNFLLPADLDGPTPPPPDTPGYFYTFKDNRFHGGRDRIELFKLEVEWANPTSATFGLEAPFELPPFTFTVCGFFNFDCARQKGTRQRIDVVSEWPMHRFPYRNFGSHESMVGTFTVGGGLGEVGAAIRWFELRRTSSGWALYQQGTFDPGDGHDRFMGSIALDGRGDIALGYSVSSSALFPSIRYATRAPGDPLGTLRPEAVLKNGGGSQTASNRWGDYSAMSIGPSGGCRFWYTNEFYAQNSATSWRTVVGVFRMPGC
jgi:hypothetical protein